MIPVPPAASADASQEPPTQADADAAAESRAAPKAERARWGVADAAMAAAAAAPLLAILVGLWSRGWSPAGDDAAIALRSFDVLSRHGPLVGQVNLGRGSQAVFDPGPLQNWVLAVPTRLLPNIGPVVGALVFDAACVAAAVLAVRRTLGRTAALLVVAGTLLGIWTTSPALASPVWNGHSPLVPFAALVVCGWAVAAGGLAWWPIVVFLGSYSTQSHLTYAPGAVAIVAVSPLLGIWAVRADGGRAGWKWFGIGGGVGLLSWSAPFWQQLTGHPGNLWLLYKATLATHQPRLGSRLAVEQLGAVLRPIPPWLRSPKNLNALKVEGLHGDQIWTYLALASLVGLAAVAVWRRDRSVVAAAAMALVADTCSLWVIGAVPVRNGLSIAYLRWSLWPGAMMTWLALGWGSVRLARPVVAKRWSGPRTGDAGPAWPVGARARAFAVSTLVVVVASVVVSVTVGGSTGRWDKPVPVSWEENAPIARGMVRLLEQHHIAKGRLRVVSPDLSSAFLPTAVYQLRVHGWHPTTLSLNAHLAPYYNSTASDSFVLIHAPGSRWPIAGIPIGAVTYRPPGGPAVSYRIYVYMR